MKTMPKHLRISTAWMAMMSATGGLLPVLAGSETTRPVLVRTVDSDPIEGQLVAVSLVGGLTLQAAGQRRSIAADGWLRITPVTSTRDPGGDSATQARPVDEVVLGLSYGDRIVGRIVEEGKDAVIVESNDLGRVTIPLDDLAQLSTAHAGSAGYRDAEDWFKRTASSNDDAILLTNGDVARGFITRLGTDEVAIDASAGPTSVPYRLIVALRVAHAAPKQLPLPFATVQLRDTSRVTALRIHGTDDGLEMGLRCGAGVRAPLDRITRIEAATLRWTWLSELRPISAEQVPMFAQGWDYRTDRNVRGGPLTVAGESFDHGLGVHARAALLYELGGAYSEFVTAFGLDDDSGSHADVTVSVLVDGRPRFQSSGIRRGTLHGPIRIDVSRAGRIELVVDFGENGDIQDRFNWIEPALVR
jgi:hypothetical protein